MAQFKQWIVALSLAALCVALAALPVPHAAAQADAPWQCVEVNAGVTLNIRSGPTLANGVIATRQPGQQLEADPARQQVAGGYTWVPVRLTGGQLGWAIARRLDPCTRTPDATAPVQPVTQTGDDPTLDDIDQDGTLDRYEIAAVARRVVLLANVRGTRIRATGTGTITTADGLIVTNAHVVEDADMVAVGVLDDINDPPEYRYLGEIIRRDEEVDVALIAIRYDIDGNPLRVADLDLPYMAAPLTAESVFRGDPVWIFGYPGIGNDFLVVTTGSIVSVENGDLFGQRLPVWYRTDAEIAPGNSGGLVVNGNGQFVGIPSFVESEGLTGGRLGGIRPAEVALMAVQNATVETPVSPAAPALTLPDTDITLPVTVDVQRVEAEHGAARFGEPGIAFHVMFVINGWEQQAAQVVARVYHDDLGSSPLENRDAPPAYRDASGAVRVVEAIEPCCAQTAYTDEAALDLFLPYSALGLGAAGTYPLQVQITVEAVDGSWQHVLSWEFITVDAG